MTTAGSKWGIVMSRNAGYASQVVRFQSNNTQLSDTAAITYNLFVLVDQVVELDFLYPSEGIHRRWEKGYRITSAAATEDQAAFVFSAPKRKSQDVMQETLRTSAFPSTHVKVI